MVRCPERDITMSLFTEGITSTKAAHLFRQSGHMAGILISMKISVNIPDDEVAFVDRAVAAGHYPSRSQAFSAAIKLWRKKELEASYERAFSQSDPAWEAVVSDGLADEKQSW